jgi:molybdate transport system permease protein
MTGWTAADLAIVLLSLKVASVATIATAPVALGIALALARGRFWGRGLLNAIVHLPLVVPPVVTGYLLLRLLGRRGLIGEWLGDTLGIVFAFRWTGAAVAAGVMGLPLMVRAMQLAIENVDRSLEEAAGTLGASPVWRFVAVTLPLALPGVIAGLVLGFAKALGEFGATIMFVSNIPGETRTLALAIFNLVETPGAEADVLRLVWLSIGLSLAALFVSEALARKARRHRS